MLARAFITGVSGPTLSAAERSFLREAEPWGFILFARNIETPEQVGRLIADCRDAVGSHAPVLVDQEGGRVQRFAPPHWPRYPAGAAYGEVYDRDHAARFEGGLAWRSPDRQRSASARRRCGLPADCRRSSCVRRSCNRQPCLRRHAGEGRGHRRGDRRGPDGRRRIARAQAPPGSRPGDGGQSP